MRLVYLTTSFLCILFSNCSKDEAALKTTCIEGKYLGTGCYDVIQITSPSDQEFTNSWLYHDDLVYQNCVAVDNLPKEYKNGDVFAFTVQHVDSVKLIRLYCTTPKYIVTIAPCENPQPVH